MRGEDDGSARAVGRVLPAVTGPGRGSGGTARRARFRPAAARPAAVPFGRKSAGRRPAPPRADRSPVADRVRAYGLVAVEVGCVGLLLGWLLRH